jgi:hypothetical protein
MKQGLSILQRAAFFCALANRCGFFRHPAGLQSLCWLAHRRRQPRRLVLPGVISNLTKQEQQ